MHRRLTTQGHHMEFVVDIEVTNRCNAKCHFCPRDRTPHQGLMLPDVYEKSLERAEEYRKALFERGADETAMKISLCGLGEPLLNKHVVDYVAAGHDAGFKVAMSSNGSLLSEDRAVAVLDAGLDQICINVGEEGDDYEEIYQLPFQRTLDNVLRFHELADGRCETVMVVVDHRSDPAHVAHMEEFWASHGIEQVLSYEVMNRGGSLFVDHMQYEQFPELEEARSLIEERVGAAVCPAPFIYLFVGYDGNYYLCCSDWEKQAPLGTIFESSFLEVADAKLGCVTSREPVCRTCNLDPTNRLVEDLRARADGEVTDEAIAAHLDDIARQSDVVDRIVDYFDLAAPPPSPAPHRLIPVRAL